MMPVSFYVRLSKRPEMFRSFTGLDPAEFDSLLSRIKLVYDDHEKKRLSRRERKNKIGAGHPFKLSLEDRLLMLLMYYRSYVTSILLGFLFNLDQSNVLKDIRMLEPLVKECIPLPEKLHEMARRARTPEEVERYFPGFKAFIDVTEQEIPRPKDALKRKTHYSGKRKKHTVKTQLTVNREGLIVHRTNHARGRRNDYAIFKRTHPELPKGVRPGVDLGYNGIQNDFPEMKAMIPFKKKSPGRGHKGEKAKPLTPYQKRFNTELSKARVVVEHTISRVKKFNIFGQEFRNRLRHYDDMTDIVSGLINFRMLGA
jgi:DDE superfamily endonuclease/Helix-turn-helix of DDE superfamily endonuclease